VCRPASGGNGITIRATHNNHLCMLCKNNRIMAICGSGYIRITAMQSPLHRGGDGEEYDALEAVLNILVRRERQAAPGIQARES
jgi:hypothetical protein